MRNIFYSPPRPLRDGPPEIYGIRIYLLVLSATWASALLFKI